MAKTKILMMVLAWGILLNPVISEPRKANYVLTGIEKQFQYLMAKHYGFIQRQNRIFDEFERRFFSDFKFVNTKNTKDFFSQLKTAGLKINI